MSLNTTIQEEKQSSTHILDVHARWWRSRLVACKKKEGLRQEHVFMTSKSRLFHLLQLRTKASLFI